MAREYHIAAVGLNARGAQDWELTAAVPLKDSDTLLLILGRELETSR